MAEAMRRNSHLRRILAGVTVVLALLLGTSLAQARTGANWLPYHLSPFQNLSDPYWAQHPRGGDIEIVDGTWVRLSTPDTTQKAPWIERHSGYAGDQGRLFPTAGNFRVMVRFQYGFPPNVAGYGVDIWAGAGDCAFWNPRCRHFNVYMHRDLGFRARLLPGSWSDEIWLGPIDTAIHTLEVWKTGDRWRLWVDGGLRGDRINTGTHPERPDELIMGDYTTQHWLGRYPILSVDYVDVQTATVPSGSISGYIWNDADNSDGPGKNPLSEQNYTASTITVRYICTSGGTGSVDTSNGNYSFSNVPPEACSVSIDTGDLAAGWSTTTLASVGVAVPAGGTATVNFGVWDNPDAWFQGCNGDAYGLGVSVPVPYDCKGCCDRWFLGADPNNTAGGVVISGNVNLTCGGGTTVDGRCSQRPSGDLTEPGWRVKNEQMAWPPLSPANLPAVPFPGWGSLAPNKVYRFTSNLTIGSGTTYNLTGGGVALIHVRNANLTFNANFISSAVNTEGVIFIVENGQVSIGGAVTRIDALILATGTGGNITVEGTNVANNLTVYGMLYAQNGINFNRTLTDNRTPAVQVKYSPLYLLPNPLARSQITWREIAP